MSAIPKRSSTTAISRSRRARSSVRQRLAMAIDRMPRRDRQVLNLILVEGFNELEAAEAMGTEVQMVRRGFVSLLRKLQRVADATDVRSTATPKTRTPRLRRAS